MEYCDESSDSCLRLSDVFLVASMMYSRVYHACAIFYSPAHDGRNVVIVAGGYGVGGYIETENTAEIWDYTNEGSIWKESKLVSLFFC